MNSFVPAELGDVKLPPIMAFKLFHYTFCELLFCEEDVGCKLQVLEEM